VLSGLRLGERLVPGPKLKKAQELGIEVIDEAAWAAIVRAAG